MTPPNQQINALPIYLVITKKHGKPVLELRKHTNDKEVIKIIITAAYANKPIILYPTFRDKLRATSTLVQRKILKYNPKQKEYKFLI